MTVQKMIQTHLTPPRDKERDYTASEDPILILIHLDKALWLLMYKASVWMYALSILVFESISLWKLRNLFLSL